MSEIALRIALVEDDADLRASTAQILTLAGYHVDSFALAAPALAAVDADYPGVVVTDVRMPQMSGIELLKSLRARDEALPVILITGHGDVAMAVDALKSGAWDFLTKPAPPEALLAAVARAATARALVLENRRLQERARSGAASGLIGDSPAIRRLRDMIQALADAPVDLLIEGETGTGKELLARVIHRSGRRARHRFKRVACDGLPDVLVDTELFATSGEGSVASSHRGTLFLDDVDRASRLLQTRLTSLVEDRALSGRRLDDAIPLDLRVIATAAEQGQRTSDAIDPALFYRLAGVRLRIPPVRERRDDVPLLFAHFASEAAARLRMEAPTLTAAQRQHLLDHDWPGNVREIAHFASNIALGIPGPAEAQASVDNQPLPVRIASFERDAIIHAVTKTHGDIAAAIEHLSIPRKTFYYKVQRLGIDLGALRRALAPVSARMTPGSASADE